MFGVDEAIWDIAQVFRECCLARTCCAIAINQSESGIISPQLRVFLHIYKGGGMKKERGGDAKLMKRNKKQMSGLHRESTGMAQLIWLVGL